MHIVRTKYLLFVYFACVSWQVHAQDQYEYRVEYFNASDGLPSNPVEAIQEDSLGFLWVGTHNGLARFDGYAFRVFFPRPKDSTSISGRPIATLHVDVRGRVWAGGSSATPHGVSYFDSVSETFTRYQHDPADTNSLIDDEVMTIVSSPDEPDVIWIGSRDWPEGITSGVSRLDITTNTFTHFTTDNGLSSNSIRDLAFTPDGTLWVMDVGGSLNRFDKEKNTFSPFFSEIAFEASHAGELFVDREGMIWIGAPGGMARFNLETQRFSSQETTYERNNEHGGTGIISLLEDRTGVFWIGTGDGLFTYDRSTQRLTRFEPHIDGSVMAIYEDRSGIIWIGSTEGLVKLVRRHNPFTTYENERIDLSTLGWVYPITEDNQGRIWLSTINGLYRINRASETIIQYPDAVNSLYKDSDGILWGGRCRGALLRINPHESYEIQRFYHDPDDPESLGTGCLNEPLEDKSGNLWIPMWSSGIDRMDRSTHTFKHYTTASHKLGNERPLKLYEAPSEPGIIWAGTESGLSRLDVKTETFVNYHDVRISRSLMMHEDRTGRFWVVTASNGLHLFNRTTGEIEQTYTTQEGLANDEVWSIYEDIEGFLWLGTSNGLSRFDPQASAFQNFYDLDGLPGNIFGEHSHYQSESGELFFGVSGKLVSFFPENVREESVRPAVKMVGLRIHEQPVQIGRESPLKASMLFTDSITLRHDQDDVTFEYVGLQLIEPSENQYRYMLEGYDENWIEAGAQRAARYTSLPPDNYVFRVAARNGNSAWDEVSIQLAILPPWWRTTWAYVFYGMLVVAGTFAVDRIQRRRLIRRERERAMVRELEQTRRIEAMNRQLQEHERQLETQNTLLERQKQRLLDLDAVKSRFFANVSHEFRTPLTLLLGPLDDALSGDRDPENLARQAPSMRRNGLRLLRLIDQLLDLSRLESGRMPLLARRADLIAFLRSIIAAFASRAERDHITLQLAACSKALYVYYEPDKLEKIVTNLLSNAFKFTPSHGKIRVSVEQGADVAGAFTEIVVRDTGQGIPAEELPRIFDRFHQVEPTSTRLHGGAGIGLALAKELVERHGGTIDVESQLGFGTAFFVRLPLGNEHLDPDDIVEEEPGETAPEAAGLEAALFDVEEDPLPETADRAKPPEGAPTILVVEDNADMRDYLRSLLAARYHVVEAGDGIDGLERARAVAPALILSDVMMPGMDGYALCEAVKSDAGLNDIPVVLLTAKASEESKLEGLDLGADDYLYKPFSAAELLLRMENLIELRRLLRRRFSEEVVVGPSAISVPSAEAEFLKRVQVIVEQHLADSNFGGDWLAEEVGLSRRHLNRKLERLTNLSAAGYIRMMRLERAAQLLEQRAGTVSEIAYRVGFNSPAHFSRLFQQVFGVAPSQYPAEQHSGE
jgi:signal transduction histidine kinase/ligand-binding sensor domain-containing protein/CheY-like chemotaxis protein